ncbi:hypothetical protein [Nitrincola nitratireducens]|uniref:Uncharacterized protein n=1 Tax=Nitrincola nitratireducens TaxID=1229521 RepID=W9V0V2_9GAMM|nr:hypothetical protein [Nitrincola nitratireducens]EXJ12949.1 hypothetical protein D791_00291 [Nitrincola nitratireducens]
MTKITDVALTSAIQQLELMDSVAKAAVCDEIFFEQPNLLASVLVLARMSVSAQHVESVLEILIVIHLALKRAGVKIELITEEAQDRELKRLVASLKFREGLEPVSQDEAIKQSISFRKEPWLLSYVYARLQDSGILACLDEDSKYLNLSALNLVECVACANRVI